MSNKQYNYQDFKLSKRISVTCWTYETRYSWGHKAELYLDGRLIDTDKIVYYNRTWERFTYESILYSIIQDCKALTKAQARYYTRVIKHWKEPKDPFMGMVASVAKMGEILTTDQKAKNDWKARMLKAGFGGRGLEMPEDWDTLSEDEKETRLNKAIEALE